MHRFIEGLRVPVAVVVGDHLVCANSALGRICRRDVVGRHWRELFAAEDHSMLAGAVEAARGGATRTHQVTCGDSTVEVSLSAGTYEGGPCVLLSLEDIGLRVMLGNRLIESEARFQRLVSGVANAIVAVDVRGRIVLWNDTATRLFGYSEDEVQHESFAMLFPEDIAGHYTPERFSDATVPALGRTIDTVARSRDGRAIPIQLTLASSDIGGTVWFTAVIHDDSERRSLVARIARSEASFRALVEQSPEAMFVHGIAEADYRIQFVNRAMLAMLGYDSADDLIGKQSLDLFVHPDDREHVRTRRVRRHAGEALPPIEVRWLTRDGRVLDIQAVSRPVTFDERPGWLVFARDVTDRLRQERERADAERVLRESEELHRALFDRNPLPAWIIDVETLRFTAVNDAMTAVYRYSREELLAMTILDLGLPEAAPSVIKGIRESSDGEVSRVGVKRHRCKDGTNVDLDITAHRMTMHGRAIVLGTGLDVTHALRLEEQLRQTQKMEAIGQLAGGVAHDFNNILAVILANADFALDTIGRDHEAAPELCEIEAAASRAASLTRQLLAFSRKEHRQVKRLALNSIVTNIEKMLSRIVGEDVRIAARLEAGLGALEGDTGQVEQVLINLVVNARDAMPTGGRIVIETANTTVDDRVGATLGVAPGSYVVLAVSDTGCGMDETVRKRIFEPFFTTKPVGKGTGLGLATVFGIVKQSGGTISVYSEPGRGTTFRIYFPRVDTPADDAAAPPRFMAAVGSGTVLVVEDDVQVRTILRRYLSKWGYTLLEASNGAAALDLARSHDGPIDLLLTDLVMPEMDGRSLSTQMKIDRPSTRVVFMSGYTEHVALQNAQLTADDHFMQKPFTAQALSETVKRVFDEVR